jgi:hypothetical protein
MGIEPIETASICQERQSDQLVASAVLPFVRIASEDAASPTNGSQRQTQATFTPRMMVRHRPGLTRSSRTPMTAIGQRETAPALRRGCRDRH